MAKITPADYVNAQEVLEQVGFKAIKASKKAISKLAVDYGISENVVELIKTTGSFEEYQTITRLEKERESLSEQLETAKQETPKPTVKPWHYAVAIAILIGIIWLGVVGLVSIFNWIGGLI